MITNIIEESYHNKNKPKKKINFNYSEPKVPFHQMEFEKINFSTWKIKRTEKKINDDIDDLLVFSLIKDETKDSNKDNNHHHIKIRQVKTPTIQPILRKRKQSKYLFKGNLLMSEKIKKTKIKEFTFSKTSKNKLKTNLNLNIPKETKYTTKNRNRNKINNILSPFHPLSAKASPINHMKFYNVSNSDCFFITKLPSYYYKDKYSKSKENKLKKMKKIIKETNSHMLDIYTGLKNMKENKFEECDDPLFVKKKIKYRKGLRNTDKIIGLHKNQSVSYINRRFKKLFQEIFNNKKISNEKIDARTLLDPLDKITGGSYKEVKLDNIINHKIGQRIWIKKSTANIVSYGKSFQLISDDIFYKERKRIIGIYPQIERDAEIFIPRKKIEKRHPLIKKLKENVQKINNVFLNEYKLLTRAKWKFSKHS